MVSFWDCFALAEFAHFAGHSEVVPLDLRVSLPHSFASRDLVVILSMYFQIFLVDECVYPALYDPIKFASVSTRDSLIDRSARWLDGDRNGVALPIHCHDYYLVGSTRDPRVVLVNEHCDSP